MHLSPIKVLCKFICKWSASLGLLAGCQLSPRSCTTAAPLWWQGTPPPTPPPPPMSLHSARRKHGAAVEGGESDTGWGEGTFRLQNLWKLWFLHIRKARTSLKGRGKMRMNVSFCEEQEISFKLLSSPPPGSLTLHPSLHSGSSNLFIRSVYRCSNNQKKNQKKPTRKTSRRL